MCTPDTRLRDPRGVSQNLSPSIRTAVPTSASTPLQQTAGSVSRQCRLTKVSMLYGAHKFSQLEEALVTHQRHSERWNCGFTSLDQDISNRRLYSKQYYLMSLIIQELARPKDERMEWVWWVDADSILINPAIPPDTFLPPAELESVYALITGDHNGLNAGIFFLRVHPSSVDFLTRIVGYPLEHPEDDLGWFGEQAAMQRVVAQIEKNATGPTGLAWLPRIWFNAYQFEHGFEGKPGNVLVHFAGLSDTRISHMQNWLDELKRDQAKWEVPFEQTMYKDQVPQFWKEYAQNLTRAS